MSHAGLTSLPRPRHTIIFPRRVSSHTRLDKQTSQTRRTARPCHIRYFSSARRPRAHAASVRARDRQRRTITGGAQACLDHSMNGPPLGCRGRYPLYPPRLALYSLLTRQTTTPSCRAAERHSKWLCCAALCRAVLCFVLASPNTQWVRLHYMLLSGYLVREQRTT